VPDAAGRAEVEAKIAELQRAIDQGEHARQGPPEGTLAPKPPAPVEPAPAASPAPAPAPASAPTTLVLRNDPRHRWYTSGAGWGRAGSGLALLTIGGGLLGESAALEGDAARAQSQVAHDAAASSAGPYRWSGAALLSVGGALVVGGVVVFALHDRRNL